jgi:hypothetical protein
MQFLTTTPYVNDSINDSVIKAIMMETFSSTFVLFTVAFAFLGYLQNTCESNRKSPILTPVSFNEVKMCKKWKIKNSAN